MQRLTIQAASPLTAKRLYSVLSEQHPDFSTDEEGTCFVSVDLGGDAHAAEVLHTLQRFLDTRREAAAADAVVVSLHERRYRRHGEQTGIARTPW